MSNALRAHGVLFAGTETIDNAGDDYSAVGSVGPADGVAIFVENTGAQSVNLTVLAGSATGLHPGRNDAPAASTMFPLREDDNSADLVLTVAAGAKACFDLSPYAPQFIALKAVAASATTTVKAHFIANG